MNDNKLTWGDMEGIRWKDLSDLTWNDFNKPIPELIEYIKNNNISIPIHTYELLNKLSGEIVSEEELEPSAVKALKNKENNLISFTQKINVLITLAKNSEWLLDKLKPLIIQLVELIQQKD